LAKQLSSSAKDMRRCSAGLAQRVCCGGAAVCFVTAAMVTPQGKQCTVFQQHDDPLSYFVQIPYVMVRGNSDYLYKPITKLANGTWGCVSLCVLALFRIHLLASIHLPAAMRTWLTSHTCIP
jgi:hypothetical protein